jgi:hypothetical protein
MFNIDIVCTRYDALMTLASETPDVTACPLTQGQLYGRGGKGGFKQQQQQYLPNH